MWQDHARGGRFREPEEECKHQRGGALTNKAGEMWRLQNRAFGGEDVATRPDATDEAWWPKGPPQPGVDLLIQDLVRSLDKPASLSLYFLLGGAGNGKSFAARELAVRLGVSLAHDPMGLARRSYKATVRGTDVVIINDATIATQEDYGEDQRCALAMDVELWWEASERKPMIAFCCVNRGIVVDELRAGQNHWMEEATIPKGVLQWLASGDHRTLDQLGTSVKRNSTELSNLENYDTISVTIGGRSLTVHALSVDASSLLDSRSHGSPAPAVQLMKDVVAKCVGDSESRPTKCPVRANVRMLRSDGVLGGWGELLRSAEIAAGRLFSYRDVWGIIALSLLGPRTGRDTDIDNLLQELNSTSDAEARLTVLLSLARYRSCVALFRSPIPTGRDANPSYPPGTPFHTGFSLVDSAMWSGDDTRHVEEAMQAIALGERPSTKLHDRIIGFRGAWSDFDSELEDALIARIQMDKCPDQVRRRLISWYSSYLMRLSCLVSGKTGNSEVLSAWRMCREAADHGPAPLPEVLRRPFMGLLYPGGSDSSDHRVLVRAFAARMEPVSARDGDRATLAEAIDHSMISLRVRKVENRLSLECMMIGDERPIGELILDFALIREALTWHAKQAGQTESTTFVEPRLERCRSASLGKLPSSQRRLVVLAGGNIQELRG